MRATVRYGKNGSGSVYAQTRPQEIPPANANSKDKGRERIHTVQQRGDPQARHLDGRAPDVQGAPQPMHEESQSSRSETLNPHKDIRGSTRERKGHPSSLRPSGRTVRERALVGSQEVGRRDDLQLLLNRQARSVQGVLPTTINNNASFRLKHPGVPNGSDGSDGISYPLTENYMLPVAQATGRVAYLPPLLCAWYTHHQNGTCVTLLAGAAVML